MNVIFIEQDRCLACRNCERVCSFQDSHGFKREYANIWVDIDMVARTIFALTCQQCEVAACLEVCPTAALTRDSATGAVIVDESICVGCRMCVNACPFGCIHFDQTKHTVSKCNLCHGTPKCVENCMAGALHYGDINDLAAIKRKKIDITLLRTAVIQKGERRR